MERIVPLPSITDSASAVRNACRRSTGLLTATEDPLEPYAAYTYRRSAGTRLAGFVIFRALLA
jgi:hypothetical protein